MYSVAIANAKKRYFYKRLKDTTNADNSSASDLDAYVYFTNNLFVLLDQNKTFFHQPNRNTTNSK